jgi:hypothetical protein
MRISTLLLLAVVAGCGTSGPLTASVAQFELKPLPAMVAKKVALPLYLVVGKDDVPEDVHVAGTTIAIFTIPDVDLKNVRTFATRDVKRAFEPYFSTVNVVYDEAQLPKTPYVRGQIKITKIEYEHRVSVGDHGQKHELFGALEWAFGLRASGADDFAFHFAERTISTDQMKSFGDTTEWQSLFQDALRKLVAEYDKSGAQGKLAADPYAAVN